MAAARSKSGRPLDWRDEEEDDVAEASREVEQGELVVGGAIIFEALAVVVVAVLEEGDSGKSSATAARRPEQAPAENAAGMLERY